MQAEGGPSAWPRGWAQGRVMGTRRGRGRRLLTSCNCGGQTAGANVGGVRAPVSVEQIRQWLNPELYGGC